MRIYGYVHIYGLGYMRIDWLGLYAYIVENG